MERPSLALALVATVALSGCNPQPERTLQLNRTQYAALRAAAPLTNLGFPVSPVTVTTTRTRAGGRLVRYRYESVSSGVGEYPPCIELRDAPSARGGAPQRTTTLQTSTTRLVLGPGRSVELVCVGASARENGHLVLQDDPLSLAVWRCISGAPLAAAELLEAETVPPDVPPVR